MEEGRTRCPVGAVGKKGGGCHVYVEPGHHAAVDGATWCKGQPICGAYCCRKEAGRNVYNHKKEQARKKLKHTPVPEDCVPHFGSLGAGLPSKQAPWPCRWPKPNLPRRTK